MPGQGLKRLWTLPIDPKKENANLKVLQWNVLADGLAQNGDFVKVHIPYSGSAMLELQCHLKCTSGFVAHLLVNRHGSDDMPVHQVTQQALCWSYRAEKLLQLILEPQPDIVCLQEVNRYGTIATNPVQRRLHILLLHGTDHFRLVLVITTRECCPPGDCLLPAMEKHGYTGAFFCKPCSPAEQYGAPCDGCALFYRSDRFDLCAEPQGDPPHHCLYPYTAVMKQARTFFMPLTAAPV